MKRALAAWPWLRACGCALLLAACSKANAPSAGHGANLVVAVPAEYASLNTIFLSGRETGVVSNLGYSFLTNYDAKGNVVTNLARDIPTLENGGISRDGTRITYHLRSDVRWQDGAPFTARDVAFTYRAIVNPANNLPERYPYDIVAGVDTPDARTVVVRLKHAFSPIVTSFFGGDSNYAILPAHLLAGYPNLNQVPFNSAPVGTGPYVFERWSRGEDVEARANPSYYAGRPEIPRITLRFVPAASTTEAQLTTGEVDATFFAEVSDIAALRAIPNHRVIVTPVPSVYALTFNMADPLAGDPVIRRAFAMAIDRKALVDKVAHGVYDAETGLRGLFTWAYDPTAGNVPYDPRGAAALLVRAGWLLGPDGIRTRNGKRLELGLSFMALSTDTELASVIAAQERAAGIDVSIKRYARQQFFGPDGPLIQGRFQIVVSDYISNYDPDPSWLIGCKQQPPAGFNVARYCNALVDRALGDATRSYDRAVRKRDDALVQRQLLADLPYYFLCQISEIDVIPSRLHGYDGQVLGTPFLTVARWHL